MYVYNDYWKSNKLNAIKVLQTNKIRKANMDNKVNLNNQIIKI